ncbi:MAG: bifunctional adenosylcobinamide kinase/adenosylcobinamide-phosphate guanylyltransferase [Geminicoccaceae bacterium]
MDGRREVDVEPAVPDKPHAMSQGASSHLTLVLGGQRSGKSAFAERLVADTRVPVTYVATAQAFDGEMVDRIEQHRARRPSDWTTVEASVDLAVTLQEVCRPETAVLVDCLTLWLTNLMLAERDIAAETASLVELLPQLPGRLVLVSVEVGQGVVPANAMARAFVDHAGRLHQAIAALADRVVLVVAGLPLDLKGAPCTS